MQKLAILFLKNLRFLTPLSVRLVKLTGKSKHFLHPKHLVKNGAPWFLQFLEPEDRVLDLGCGNGSISCLAAMKVFSVLGLDSNPKQLEVAQDLKKEKKIANLTFSTADLEENLKFKNGSFNKILYLDVLEHLHNRRLALLEVVRVLKPGGLLLLSVPNSQTSWKKTQRRVGINSFTDPDHKTEYSLDQIKTVCLKAGLKILEIKPVTLDTPLAPIIDIAGGLSLGLYTKLSAWKRSRVLESPEESIGFRLVARKK